MNSLFNLARVITSTVGTGTITLGAAVSGGAGNFLTFAQAGVPDGAVVSYGIIDPVGGNSEVGKGTYTASGTTLSRDTVYRSTGAGNTAKIALSGSAQVFISPAAEDFAAITLGTTAFKLGDTVATISGVTLSGGTLSGATTLPGSGQITSGGRLGLGITPSTKLHIFDVQIDPSISQTNFGSFSVAASGQLLSFGVSLSSPFGAWIQSHVNFANTALPLLLNPSGGGVSIGTTTDPGAGNLLVNGTVKVADNLQFGGAAASGVFGNGTDIALRTFSGGIYFQNANGVTTYGFIDTSGNFNYNGPIRTGVYTVATLPTAGTAGRRAFVTDNSGASFGAAVVGGGANFVPVFDAGAWYVG